MSTFNREDVRLAEALYRSTGHCHAACELYVAGRPSEALLQAARPMTDVLPWLETEQRSNTPELAAFMKSVARVGAEVRHGAKRKAMRTAFRNVETTADALLDASVGDASTTQAFLVVVAMELLGSALSAYERAVVSGDVDDYRTAYACASETLSCFEDAGIDWSDRACSYLELVHASFPAIDPPASLIRPDTLREAIDTLREELGARFDLPNLDVQELEESLTKIERLLDDTVAAHADGVPALAARLSATLFLRAYDPIRDRIADRSAPIETRLSELLGIEVRKAINQGVSVKELDGLRQEAKQLIDATRSL